VSTPDRLSSLEELAPHRIDATIGGSDRPTL
jgi:hypothetical protein